MDIVKITCTDTDKTLNGDVLRKSDKFIEVAVEGTGAKLRLSKKTPHDKLYIGRLAGLEFTSTGKSD